MMKISKLYFYPIKSLRACEPDSAGVTELGFAYDRHFMILQEKYDKNGNVSYKNMHVAEFSEMVLFFPSVSIPDGDAARGTISVTFKPPQGQGDSRTLNVPLLPEVDGLEVIDVDMHKSPTKAYKMPQNYCDWLSECFGFEVTLAYIGKNRREILMSTDSKGDRQPVNGDGNAGGWFSSVASRASQMIMGGGNPSVITFSDCAPYLIVSEKSMEDVDNRLPDGETMDISKFRPNIIVSGADEEWEEDYWGEITIAGKTKIECAQNCARCQSINIDYATGKPGQGEPGKILKKLQSDRRVDPGAKYSPIFGRYSFLHPSCEGQTIHLGDEVVVSRKNAERTKFDWKGLATK